MKKLLILLGAMALTFTLATAEGKCSGDKKCNSGEKTQKCDSSKKAQKCEGDKKGMKCEAGKCGGEKKKAPKKGKCGEGKCG